jgi:hypothetical protein
LGIVASPIGAVTAISIVFITMRLVEMAGERRSFVQDGFQPIGEAHERCAIDDVVIDAESEMDEGEIDVVEDHELRAAKPIGLNGLIGSDCTDIARGDIARDRYRFVGAGRCSASRSFTPDKSASTSR